MTIFSGMTGPDTSEHDVAKKLVQEFPELPVDIAEVARAATPSSFNTLKDALNVVLNDNIQEYRTVIRTKLNNRPDTTAISYPAGQLIEDAAAYLVRQNIIDKLAKEAEVVRTVVGGTSIEEIVREDLEQARRAACNPGKHAYYATHPSFEKLEASLETNTGTFSKRIAAEPSKPQRQSPVSRIVTWAGLAGITYATMPKSAHSDKLVLGFAAAAVGYELAKEVAHLVRSYRFFTTEQLGEEIISQARRLSRRYDAFVEGQQKAVARFGPLLQTTSTIDEG